MINGSVGRRYAKALLNIGLEKGNLSRLQMEVEKMADVWKSGDDLKLVMGNPVVDKKSKLEILKNLLMRTGASTYTNNFFGLLFEKNRLNDLPGISRELKDMCDKTQNRLRVKLKGATEVSENVASQVKRALQEQTKKTVVISKEIDPSLIGGLVTQVSNLVIDGSFKMQLAQIRKKIGHGA